MHPNGTSLLVVLIAFSLAAPEPQRQKNDSQTFEFHPIAGNDFESDLQILAMIPYHPYFDLCQNYVDRAGMNCGSPGCIVLVVAMMKIEKGRKVKYQENRIENRAIVTCRRGMNTPTWNGHLQAEIIDPTIWYFDPDLRFSQQTLREAAIGPTKTLEPATPATAMANPAIQRRTLIEYLMTHESEFERQSGPSTGFSFVW